MTRSWRLLRAIAFSFDAEKVHDLSCRILGFLGAFGGGRLLLRLLSGTTVERTVVSKEVAGLEFRNPIGLAAGFDKTGKLLRALPSLGFGFVEVGTVTPKPQPGNIRPRLFRDPDRLSLFNRMGFNSPGAEEVAAHVRRARDSGVLPAGFRIGINIGKNKDTSAEFAHLDYQTAIQPFENLADFVVINVSSPNTPGLRDLQTLDSIRKIVVAVRDGMAGWKNLPPVFLKLAPELEPSLLEQFASAEKDLGIQGWVLSNTLGGYWRGGRGGWSGGALGMISRTALEKMRARSGLPIISVGGILDGREALERLDRGASLVEVYTGWVYFGPTWIPKLLLRIGLRSNHEGWGSGSRLRKRFSKKSL